MVKKHLAVGHGLEDVDFHKLSLIFTRNLSFKPLTQDNIEEMLALVKVMFPNDENDAEAAEKGYRASINSSDPRWNDRRVLKYWGVYDDTDNLLAVTGLYNKISEHAENEIWLGWYGVSPSMRGRGIGRRVLEWTLEAARKEGYRKFRLWTTTSPEEAAAQKLYDSIGIKIYKEERKEKSEYVTLYREIEL